jgi:hypothetical protein
MGSTRLKASMAWYVDYTSHRIYKYSSLSHRVVPVRPDLLGPHLKAFEEAVPVLRTLRLCHRFGKGPDVHINKLPAELELLIEQFSLEPRRCKSSDFQKNDWKYDFRCFESRCSPLFHMSICTPYLDSALHGFVHCGNCPGDDFDYANCEMQCKNTERDPCEECSGLEEPRRWCLRSCRSRERVVQEDAAAESELWYELHNDSRREWIQKVSDESCQKMSVVRFGRAAV